MDNKLLITTENGTQFYCSVPPETVSAGSVELMFLDNTDYDVVNGDGTSLGQLTVIGDRGKYTVRVYDGGSVPAEFGFEVIGGAVCSLFVFIKRIIEVTVLYLTAPFFVSAMPLDGGAVFAKWRQMFIGKLFTGFGIIISMKLVFMLTPIIFTPNLRLYGASTTVDSILKTVFMVASFYAAWKSSTLITELISPEAAMAERDSLEAVGTLRGRRQWWKLLPRRAAQARQART